MLRCLIHCHSAARVKCFRPIRASRAFQGGANPSFPATRVPSDRATSRQRLRLSLVRLRPTRKKLDIWWAGVQKNHVDYAAPIQAQYSQQPQAICYSYKSYVRSGLNRAVKRWRIYIINQVPQLLKNNENLETTFRSG